MLTICLLLGVSPAVERIAINPLLCESIIHNLLDNVDVADCTVMSVLLLCAKLQKSSISECVTSCRGISLVLIRRGRNLFRWVVYLSQRKTILSAMSPSSKRLRYLVLFSRSTSRNILGFSSLPRTRFFIVSEFISVLSATILVYIASSFTHTVSRKRFSSMSARLRFLGIPLAETHRSGLTERLMLILLR